MAELENLIKQMIDNGESEQAIDMVVKAYKEKHGDSGDTKVEENIFYDKPENEDQVLSSLRSIDNISYENDNIVKEEVIDNYFGFNKKDFRKFKKDKKKERLEIYKKGGGYQPLFKEDEEDLIKEFLGDKYDDYKLYQETGQFDLNKIDKETRADFLNKRKLFKRERYFDENIKRNDQQKYRELSAVSLFNEFLDEIDEGEGEEYNKMRIGMTLVARPWESAEGRYSTKAAKIPSILGFGKENYLPEDMQDLKSDINTAIEIKSNYLTKQFEEFESDVTTYNDYFEKNKDSTDPEVINDIISQGQALIERNDKLFRSAAKLNDDANMLMGLSKSYDTSYRALLNIEQSLTGAKMMTYGLLTGVSELRTKLDSKPDVDAISGADFDEIDESPEESLTKAEQWDDHVKNQYKAHINYYESVLQKQQAQVPMKIELKDKKGRNYEKFKQIIGDNAFSIGIGLAYGGYAANAATKIGSRALINKASRNIMALWFGVEGGAKLGEMEIAQKNAENVLPKLYNMLDAATNEQERISAQRDIDYYENAMSYTDAEKAFSAILYGGIASFAERLGSMRQIEDLVTWAKGTGKQKFKKLIREAPVQVFKFAGIETIEEAVTEIGHNLVDVLVLKEDKSLIEGLDPEFFANVVVSSLAMGGPSMGMGAFNALAGEVKSDKDIKNYNGIRDEVIEIQEILETDLKVNNLSQKERKSLLKRRRRLLDAANMQDVMVLFKLQQLDSQDIAELFELNRQRRAVLIEETQEGSRTGKREENNITKKRRARNKRKLIEINAKREEILSKPEYKRLENLKKSLGYEADLQTAFDYGRFLFNMSTAKALGGNTMTFKRDELGKLNDYLDTKNISSQKKAEYIQAFLTNGNASYIGNDILLFEDNIIANIEAKPEQGRSAEERQLIQEGYYRSLAVQAPLHELQHRRDKKAGLIKNDKLTIAGRDLVKDTIALAEERVSEGKMSKKALRFLKQRIKDYKGDHAELLTAIGDLKREGFIPKEETSFGYSLKRFLNNLLVSHFGDNASMIRYEKLDDVLNYIDNFNRQVQGRGTFALPPEEELEEEEVKKSLGWAAAVNKIYEQQGEAGAMDIIERLRPARTNTVTRNYEGVPGYEFELLRSEIEFGPRGIFDLIRDYPKYVEKQNKKGETPIELSKFINNVIVERAIDAKDIILKAAFTEDVTTKPDIKAEEPTIETSDNLETPLLDNISLNKKVNFKGKKTKIENVVKSILKTIIGSRLPAFNAAISKNKSITPLISEIKKALGTALQSYMLDLIGRDGAQLRKFLKNKKYKKAILDAMTTTWLSKNMPGAVQKSVGGERIINEDKTTPLKPKWTKDYKGKKIDRWNSSDVGPYRGMTDGKQVIKRSEDRMEDVTDDFLVDKYTEQKKTKVSVKQGTTEGLAYQLGSELGLEIFRNDIALEGELFEMLKERQELLDVIIADNIQAQLIGQLERGTIKLSSGLKLRKGATGAVMEIVRDTIKNFNKKLPFGGFEDMIGKYPEEIVMLLENLGLFDLFNTKTIKGFKKPIIAFKNRLWSGLAGSYAENGTFTSKEAKEQAAEIAEALIELLHPQILRVLPDGFFGFHYRLLDAAFKKEDPNWDGQDKNKKYRKNKDGSFVTGEYNYLKKKLDARRKEKDTKDADLNFDPSGFEMLNSKKGLMKEINKIRYKDYSKLKNGKQKKIDEIKELFGDRIENANTTNSQMMQYLGVKIAQVVAENPNMALGLARILEAVTNNVEGFRAATRLAMIHVTAESAAPYYNPKTGKYFGEKITDTKSKNYNPDIIVNRNHPYYSEALKINPEDPASVLITKGEHIDPSANVMFDFFKSIINHADLLNLHGYTEKMDEYKDIINDLTNDIADVIKNFDQSLGPKIHSNVQDSQLTSTARQGYARNFVNSENLGDYINTKDYGPVDKLIELKVMGTLNMTPLEVKINANNFIKAINQGRKTIKLSKGISILDFDDTLATTKSKVLFETKDGTKGSLTAEQYAKNYVDLQKKGYKFDFSEFNVVVKGKTAPLFNKALKLAGKFGTKDMFVLTARPPQAQKAIYEFLKAQGLDIPMKNITGLGNSTAEAKALWVAGKVAEGYNDFYFADDALQNVEAVNNMLEQFDVKRKVQQAKLKLSKGLDVSFNNILEYTKGIPSKQRFSDVKARKRGAKKGRFDFFLPPSHEDFAGLLYYFLGKGKQGLKNYEFFKETLIDPLNRAYRELNQARQSIANSYNALKKEFPDIRKKLNKTTPDGDFTYSDAVRVYLWDKFGFDIPGLSKADQKSLVKVVMGDKQLQTFADALGVISKIPEGYTKPSEHWVTEDIRNDLDNAVNKIGRKQFLEEFIENAEVIFSKENLNKIEAAFGANFREALEDVLYRTINGTNRNFGKNRLVNEFQNWINGSIGATMFVNARSAVLQSISWANFINYGDNNVFKAAAAIANQKQFWTDFAMLFNSDFLKQRRAGLKSDVNAAELASYIRKSGQPIRAAINYLLNKGFLPTQMMDSFAIALGGATLYRNRIKTYIKQGLSRQEAEQKAFVDFQDIAETTQQSARPDKISQQQASVLGRLILAFQNTPSQYMRVNKKEISDIINGRYKGLFGQNSLSAKVGRIMYYTAIQNLIFYSLQTALFAMMFGDDDDENDRFFKFKKERVANGMMDTILRGMGIGGAIVSTLKNMAIQFAKQEQKDWNEDEGSLLIEFLNLSPPIGIKARKLDKFQKAVYKNKDLMKEMETFNINNPMWTALTNLIETTTNLPLARIHNKALNLSEAFNSDNEAWQRVALGLGWSRWELGVTNEEIEQLKDQIKQQKKQKTKHKPMRF